jgi:hypothetical protein
MDAQDPGDAERGRTRTLGRAVVRRMRSDARPPRRMLTISVAFALGTIVTGVIRLFVL